MDLITIILAVLLVITALFTIYYWADFYLRGAVHVIEDEWYVRFEKSFPVADLWGLTICSLIGAVGLLTEQSYGPFFSLLAAGSMIFLALMDITFNIQNGLYPLIALSNQMVLELVINLWTLVLGITLILHLWPILV
ncbi:MAG: hypothetical protein OEX10_03025 [Candidatus Bathyarchaeota archaeon]|nr:hypothetical protein [Candidatus Bathyarchaeota archaeon]MDH5663275.1 hypothetical protein [Candidatus Bathyarchaeota archaeon]